MHLGQSSSLQKETRVLLHIFSQKAIFWMSSFVVHLWSQGLEMAASQTYTWRGHKPYSDRNKSVNESSPLFTICLAVEWCWLTLRESGVPLKQAEQSALQNTSQRVWAWVRLSETSESAQLWYFQTDLGQNLPVCKRTTLQKLQYYEWLLICSLYFTNLSWNIPFYIHFKVWTWPPKILTKTFQQWLFSDLSKFLWGTWNCNLGEKKNSHFGLKDAFC